MTRRRARVIALVVGALLLGGCAVADVVMVDPRTGATAVCRDESHGLNPWSQREACVGDYIARGWTRTPGE
jgi:hypothetical protein